MTDLATILPPGTALYRLAGAPDEGDRVVIRTRGKFREVTVTRIGTKRVATEYVTTPGGITTKKAVPFNDVYTSDGPPRLYAGQVPQKGDSLWPGRIEDRRQFDNTGGRHE